jgi:hypothetical protein
VWLIDYFNNSKFSNTNNALPDDGD